METNDAAGYNAKMKDANGIIEMEVERIVNQLPKHGFVISDKDNTLLYMALAVESLANKSAAMVFAQEKFGKELMSYDRFFDIILASLEAHFKIIYAINGNRLKPDCFYTNDELLKIARIKAFIGYELSSLVRSLSGL